MQSIVIKANTTIRTIITVSQEDLEGWIANDYYRGYIEDMLLDPEGSGYQDYMDNSSVCHTHGHVILSSRDDVTHRMTYTICSPLDNATTVITAFWEAMRKHIMILQEADIEAIGEEMGMVVRQ